MSAFEKISINVIGASHEESIGVEIEGLPKGATIDMDALQAFVDRRKSGRYAFSTPRQEEDKVEIVSGIVDGKIVGKVVARIKNGNVRPEDYSFDRVPRPSHADYVAKVKYGHAPSGGGRFSGRMTAATCIAGGIAEQILEKIGVDIAAYISEIGGIECYTYDNGIPNYDLIKKCHNEEFPIPDLKKLPAVREKLYRIASDGDTAGGCVECIVYHSPVGVGGPIYEGLEGKVAFSLFAIPAVKAVESGLGKGFASRTGLTANDVFSVVDGKVVTTTDRAGGINGGITNGMPITFRATFRPTPSVAAEQTTADIETGEMVSLKIKGRHDVAFLPRAVVVVESAVALAYLDAALLSGVVKSSD